MKRPKVEFLLSADADEPDEKKMAVPDLPGDADGDKDTARDGSGHGPSGNNNQGSRAGSITLNLSEISQGTLEQFEVRRPLMALLFLLFQGIHTQLGA